MDARHRRLDELKTTIVRASASGDLDAVRVAANEAWVLSRDLQREADIAAIYELVGITVSEDDKGAPTFSVAQLDDA